jgi:bifunctional UDP-N-acetylglucosamine pyrophosphorylase / glucosamine-1-phosphate N-acetyltransferase
MTGSHDRIGIILLGAGKGRRMESDLPKVLVPLAGKPMISHIIETLRQVNASWPPIIVVGYRADDVKQTLGNEFIYALQTESLGTGHAVLQAEAVARGKYEHIVVLYGDQPLITAEIVNNLIQTHLQEQADLTLMTVRVPNFEGWYAGFKNFGRVARGADGKLLRIIEKRDATPEQLEITEVNPAYFCFRADWLWQHLSELKNDNAQDEYYLTDLLAYAIHSGARVTTFLGDPKTALGANSKEELELLERVFRGEN